MSVLTYVEELERKTVAFCEDAALRHEQGVYSDRELLLVMNAAWQCTGGLVDDMSEIMGHVADMGLPDVTRMVAVPENKGDLVRAYERKGADLSWWSPQDSTAPIKTYSFDTEAEATQTMKTARAKLVAKGYTIL